MNMDNENLEEAMTATNIVEKTEVFDKVPPASIDGVLESSFPQSKWDKLVVDVAKVKKNQVEISKELDLVLKLYKDMKILETLNKKEQSKPKNYSDATASKEFLYPPRYAFPAKCTPLCTTNPLSLQIDLNLGIHEVQPDEAEGVQF